MWKLWICFVWCVHRISLSFHIRSVPSCLNVTIDVGNAHVCKDVSFFLETVLLFISEVHSSSCPV